MRKIHVVLLLTSIIAAYGPAATALDFPQGFYGGLGFGVSETDESACEIVNPNQFNCDDESFAWKLYAGYQILKWVGVEVGYYDLGNSSAFAGSTNLEAEVDGFTGAVTATVPILERVGFLAKVGYFLWDGELSGSLNGVPVSISDVDNDLFWGFGFRLPFTEKFGVGVEYERFLDVGNDSVFSAGKTDIDYYSVSFLYSF